MRARPNLVLAAVAGVVVALAVVAGVVATVRAPSGLDAATPEGTVQLFVLAMIDRDDERAVQLLDPDLGCTAPLSEVYRPDSVSLAVVDVTRTGDAAVVTVQISERNGLLDAFSHREVYELSTRGSGWAIQGHPWPIFSCE